MMVSIGDLDLVADSCLLDLDPFMSVTSDRAVASGLFRGMLRNIDTIVMNRIGCYVVVVFLHFVVFRYISCAGEQYQNDLCASRFRF